MTPATTHDDGPVVVEEACYGPGFAIPAAPAAIANADELLAIFERINALRSPDAHNSIGDQLGGLGDWLEDAIAKARGCYRSTLTL